ncbi:MAG: DUF2079 domain-containing protein [Candidatus Eremiobacteraeota bacterium]|nr:DUF2079 domain-containing protein [Candidatus Eremiobacteraeota bacterium]
MSATLRAERAGRHYHRAAARQRNIAGSLTNVFPPVAFGAQAFLLASLSLAQVSRDSLTWDFANIYQSWHLIAHGTFDPVMTAAGWSWLHDHFSLLLWPLALVGVVWDSPLALKLLQDGAVFATGILAYVWICEIAAERLPEEPRLRAYVAFAGLALLVLNPWVYMSNAFDVHMYAFEALILIALARALYVGKRFAAVFFAIAGVAGGSVAATLVAATGVAFATRRRARLTSLVVAALGFASAFALSKMHVNNGDSLVSNFGYLMGPGAPPPAGVFDLAAGIVRHPEIAFGRIAGRAGELYANLAPAGFFGLLCPFTAVPAVLVFAENFLGRSDVMAFDAPGGQNIFAYPFLAVGFAWFCAHVGATRIGRIVPALALAGAINAGGWFAVWYPHVSERWIRISDGTAAAVTHATQGLSADDEVVASQGIVGAFAGRRSVYAILGGDVIPIRERRTFALVTTTEGIEVASYEQRYAAIAAFLATPGVKVVSATDRLWVFQIDGPRLDNVTIAKTVSQLPAGVFATETGHRVLDGGRSDIVADPQAAPGYLVRGSLWRRPPGHYVASVAIRSGAPVTVEVWDVHANRAVAARTAIPDGPFDVPFAVANFEAPPTFEGWWIFGYTPSGPQVERLYDVRVRATPGAGATVESVAIGEGNA